MPSNVGGILNYVVMSPIRGLSYHTLILCQDTGKRWERLLANTDSTHSIETPTQCFHLLIDNTPACEYLTRLRIGVNDLTAGKLQQPALVGALQRAKGLRLLVCRLGLGGSGMENRPAKETVAGQNILGLARQLKHVKEVEVVVDCRCPSETLTALSNGLEERNRDWVAPEA